VSEVKIPFKPYFKEPLLNGTKVYTSRSKPMGQPGDTFTAFGSTFELLSVKDAALFEVASLWKEEGCNSREHFIEVWNEIHPVKRYDDWQRTYLHHFRKLVTGCIET
jgi:hypothetical protein